VEYLGSTALESSVQKTARLDAPIVHHQVHPNSAPLPSQDVVPAASLKGHVFSLPLPLPTADADEAKSTSNRAFKTFILGN
jgi:hypothetical protein